MKELRITARKLSRPTDVRGLAEFSGFGYPARIPCPAAEGVGSAPLARTTDLLSNQAKLQAAKFREEGLQGPLDGSH
jgi:hypothetical protein